MLVPQEFLQHTNPYSGWIEPGTPHASHSPYSLFVQSINKKYLAIEMYKLLTSTEFVSSRGGDESLVDQFRSIRRHIPQQVAEAVEAFQFNLPPRSDHLLNNPVRQLDRLNRQFLMEISKLWIHNYMDVSPVLFNRFHNVSPESGLPQDDKYSQYTAKSYEDGTWHPEELFLNHPLATDNSWKLQKTYTEDPRRRWGRDHGGVRFWVRTVHNRHYDRDNSDGLRDGGDSDRRVQVPHGYGKDMDDLAYHNSKFADVLNEDLIDSGIYDWRIK